ncbi:MAG TPA: hypothetical protein VGD14_04490 [bacterium]
MNRFVKKLLARYVKYIEIIGYAFVILFIAGLVALSYIKAEDEFVTLNGKFEIPTDLIQLDRSHYVIDQLSDSNSVVDVNAPLFEITGDEKIIADQTILNSLEQQAKTAQKASQKNLENELNRIISDLVQKKYPYLEKSTLRSKISGDFIITQLVNDIIPENQAIGGVFDFDKHLVRVTDFPADKRMKRKLKLGQTGIAALKLSPIESISLSVSLISLDEKEAIFQSTEISKEVKFKVAKYLCSNPNNNKIDTNISVLVGWKSWMRLIWR